MFKWLNSKKKDNKGFTLVELVIVVAILAILVGLLAPQYTKYVEKSRKAADASNVDEMVKVIKVYAADPANELEMGHYKITINSTETTITDHDGKTPLKTADAAGDTDGLATELKNSIPNWNKTKLKSQKWGDNGENAAITADVEVKKDGGTSVEYSGAKFKNYMSTGSEK